MNPSTALARDVVTALLAAGVREVVLCPGSRNAPLSFAVHDAARADLLRLHTRVDERTAGFLALGLTKVGARAAVVCTSGTAVANLLPAVMESAHAGLDLVVVTADRPARMRGTGANQTTDQVGVFGAFAPTTVLEAGGPAVGGVLSAPTDRSTSTSTSTSRCSPTVRGPTWPPTPGPCRGTTAPSPSSSRPAPAPSWWPATTQARPRGCWPRTPAGRCWPSRPAARAPATTPSAPTACCWAATWATASSGSSWPGTRRCPAPSPGCSGARTSRSSRCAPGASGRRGPFAVGQEADGFVAAPGDPAWLEEWREADRSVGRQLDRLLAAEPDLTPYEVAGAVSRALPPGGLLHVGASSPIRDLDLMVARYAVGDRRKVIANRGLAGIDGTVSTAIGAALGRPRSTRALALMGDVTFVHDMTGLVLGPREQRPDLTVVVVNDNGGSIFSMLEQGADEHRDAFDTLFGTPHDVDLASLCAATRTPHLRVTSLPELEQALGSPNGGIEVVEAVVRRDNRRDLDARIRALRPGSR